MTYAPYLVYTPDKDFVLEKDDVSGGGGSGGGVFLIESESTESGTTLKKTWKEIKDAYISGKQCIITMIGEVQEMAFESYLIVAAVNKLDTSYSIFASDSETYTFVTDSENGYPTFTVGD